LTPVQVIIPPGSLLDPSDGAAVVGGNVLTSQRIVDVVLRAFAACAASQGCMNNITFGSDTWGYYETVAGGAGAVSTFHHVLYYTICLHYFYLIDSGAICS
jgi:5-oxoprolinase (ATP-hydrolysing)